MHVQIVQTSSPAKRLVLDTVSRFISSVQSSLTQGIVRNYKFCVEFRLDVFRFLFNGKGSAPPAGMGMMYGEKDFDGTFFSSDWAVVYDRLGDVCKVDFPIRLRPSIKYGPKCYDKCGDSVILKPRHFTEVVYVTLLKKRC